MQAYRRTDEPTFVALLIADDLSLLRILCCILREDFHQIVKQGGLIKSLSVALCFFWITMLCSFTVLAELPWELAEGKWKGQSEKYRGGMMKVGMKFYATGKVHYMRSETLQFHTADDNRLWEGIWAKEPGFFGKKSCPTAPDDADSWGVVTFQFNEAYTEFEGSWDYCGEGKKFKWTGKRKAK